jgi:hypothetical protein
MIQQTQRQQRWLPTAGIDHQPLRTPDMEGLSVKWAGERAARWAVWMQ